MILQGLSAETLARLVSLARQGYDYSVLEPEPDTRPEAEEPPHPAFRLATE